MASIIVYEDQEEAVAMASEFDDIHDELAMDAVSSRASLSAKHSASHDAAAKAAESAGDATPESAIDVEAVDAVSYTHLYRLGGGQAALRRAVHHHVHASGRQLAGHGASDAAGGAGHNGAAAVF